LTERDKFQINVSDCNLPIDKRGGFRAENTISLIMKFPAASYGVSKKQPHRAFLAASCGELAPKEIRNMS